MTFKLLVNGEEVKVFDEQVTKVSLMTSRGLAGSAGISTEGSVDIQVEIAQPGGPMRLDHLEALQRREDRERSEGLVVGSTPQKVGKELSGTQGEHDYTARPGGVENPQGANPPGPSRDLAEGLESSDTDTLTARVEAFASSGDADAAINDNPAGSGPSVPVQEPLRVESPVEETIVVPDSEF